jgi:hypothetical protein
MLHPAFLSEKNQKKMEAELLIQSSMLLTYGLTDPFPVHDDAWMEDLIEIISLYFELSIPS